MRQQDWSGECGVNHLREVTGTFRDAGQASMAVAAARRRGLQTPDTTALPHDADGVHVSVHIGCQRRGRASVATRVRRLCGGGLRACFLFWTAAFVGAAIVAIWAKRSQATEVQKSLVTTGFSVAVFTVLFMRQVLLCGLRDRIRYRTAAAHSHRSEHHRPD